MEKPFEVEIDNRFYSPCKELESEKCTGCVALNNYKLCNELSSIEDCLKNATIWRESGMKAYKAPTTNAKETNPKDSVGVKKAPLSVVPTQVIHEIGLGMLEGALKYGRHNYRVAGVKSSVYYDALMRHMNQWWEGEDIDGPSGLSHITKAMSTLAVLRDAMLQEKLTDDRPPPVLNKNWMEDYNQKAAELIEKYPEPVAAYTKENA